MLSRLLPLAPFLLLAPFARHAAWREDPVELTLKPYVASLRTVDIEIGGKPATCLFDTGGGFTVVTPKVAAAAGAELFGRGTGFRHDGSRVDGPRATPIAMRIGPITRSEEVGVIDLDAMLKGLPPIAGVVCLETFGRRAITVDFARNRVWIETAASLADRVKEMRELRVRIGHQAGGASVDLFVAVEGKHGPQWFELDCANTQGVLIAPHALPELGLSPPDAGKPLEAELPLVGFGKVRAKAAVKEMIYDGLLDAGFFERHVVAIDLAAGRAWVKSN